MGFLTTLRDIFIGALGLGIMIFVHELGHLLVAKLLKVKVETFSIGYGRKLWGFTRGGTTYQIAIFPFGGFCKMKGEHSFARAVQENLDRIPDDPDSYYQQRPWKRILISLAGAAANIVFAIVFFTVLYLAGFNEYSSGNRIILASELMAVAPERPSPADAAGLRTGDAIIAVDGRATRHAGEVRRAIAFAPGKTLTLGVRRADGKDETISITPRLDPETASGLIGVIFMTEPVVEQLAPATAAQNTWLVPGARITHVDGKPAASNFDVLMAFKGKPASLPMTIALDGAPAGRSITRDFTPVYAESGLQSLGLGFRSEVFRTPSYTLGGAFVRGADEFLLNAYSLVHFFSLIPQKINVSRVVGGPLQTTVTIVQYTASGLERGLDQGIVQFVQLLCMLSTILALMNLLPLPFLDGGYVVLFLIEWLRRKPFRPRFLFRFQLVGIGILGVLFVLVMLNDILRFLKP